MFPTDAATVDVVDGNGGTHCRSLRHPHIVQFMGLCKHEHELFIITEYVDGGDLYDKLRDPSVCVNHSVALFLCTQSLFYCVAIKLLHTYTHRKLPCF
jgi:serine/threonine protein kinase